MATGIWHPWSMATAQDQGIPIKRERQNYGKLVQILTVGSCVPALWVQVLGCAEGSREECGQADALITTYCCPGCCSPPLLWKENKFVFILSLRCACRPLLSMLFSTVPPEPEQRLVLCHPGTGLPAGPRTSLCSVSPPGQSRNCEQSRGQPGCSCIPCPPSASILFQQVWGHAAAGTLAVQGWYQRGGGDSRDPWWGSPLPLPFQAAASLPGFLSHVQCP